MRIFKHVAIIAMSIWLIPEAHADDLTFAQQTQIRSETLEEDRTLLVVLPEGYEEDNLQYPVLYLLDAEDNILHTAGTVDQLTASGIVPPMIIIGIVSTNRERDFTPTEIETSQNSGGADRFLDFLDSELIPHVEQSYRTYPFRILSGHSFGGLLTAYTLMERPGLFDGLISGSPSMWWDGEIMISWAQSTFSSIENFDNSIYFGIGAEDGYGMRQELQRFIDVVESTNPDGLDWMHEEIAREDHMSARLLLVYNGLRHIFADIRVPDELRANFNTAAFMAHDMSIVEKYGPAAKQQELIYHMVADLLIRREQYDDAITVSERLIEAYPSYHLNFSLLAQAYEANGNCSRAIGALETAALLGGTDVGSSHAAGYREQIETLQNCEE